MPCSTNNNKSVTFAPTATMRLALHITDYTDDEIDACYYSYDDYRSFKGDIKRTARILEMKQKLDDTTSCVRGVESYTKTTLKKKSATRKRARLAVFKEVGIQFEEGLTSYDDDKIAAAYQREASESATAAYLAGLSDEAIVMEPRKQLDNRNFSIQSSISCNILRLSSKGNRNVSVRNANAAPVNNAAA